MDELQQEILMNIRCTHQGIVITPSKARGTAEARCAASPRCAAPANPSESVLQRLRREWIEARNRYWDEALRLERELKQIAEIRRTAGRPALLRRQAE